MHWLHLISKLSDLFLQIYNTLILNQTRHSQVWFSWLPVLEGCIQKYNPPKQYWQAGPITLYEWCYRIIRNNNDLMTVWGVWGVRWPSDLLRCYFLFCSHHHISSHHGPAWAQQPRVTVECKHMKKFHLDPKIKWLPLQIWVLKSESLPLFPRPEPTGKI